LSPRQDKPSTARQKTPLEASSPIQPYSLPKISMSQATTKAQMSQRLEASESGSQAISRGGSKRAGLNNPWPPPIVVHIPARMSLPWVPATVSSINRRTGLIHPSQKQLQGEGTDQGNIMAKPSILATSSHSCFTSPISNKHPFSLHTSRALLTSTNSPPAQADSPGVVRLSWVTKTAGRSRHCAPAQHTRRRGSRTR
jgi:hypothetical protein